MPKISFRAKMETSPPPPPPPPLPECFPELTPLAELKSTLTRFDVQFSQNASHEDLLKLYRAALCPKPQRTTARSNRRGQRIQMKQIRQEKAAKRKSDLEANGVAVKKFAPAESVRNKLNVADPPSDLDPVNGRLKPTPSVKSILGSCKNVCTKSLDTLAHIKINEGPTRRKNKSEGLETPTSAANGVDKDGPEEASLMNGTPPMFWNMFGSVSESRESTSCQSSSSTSSSSSPAASIGTKLSDDVNMTDVSSQSAAVSRSAPRRILKLNRKSVLPSDVAALVAESQSTKPITSPPVSHSLVTPASSSSSSSPMERSPRIHCNPELVANGARSDSESDMDVADAGPVQSGKGIIKITWP